MQEQKKTRSGVIAAGNWIVDHLKVIDLYPVEQALANIREESLSNGGSPYNILKNLAKLGARFPLKGIGLVGEDDYGVQIHRDCQEHGIDSTGIKVSPSSSTSYTDVMVVQSTGRRTFFHQRGANAFLDASHFDFSNVKEKIFHLGYLLLLDSLDKIYDDGMSGAARVLQRASGAGLKVSVDLVSEDSDRFIRIIHPSLPFIDYLFLNEFEARKCTAVALQGDEPDYADLDNAATIMLNLGVREWVFIHFPAGVFAKSKRGEVVIQGALCLSKEKVVSTSGAGDALASGILFGVHEGWHLQDALRLGVWSAACCLQELSCSKGILHHKEYIRLKDTFEFKPIFDKEHSNIK